MSKMKDYSLDYPNEKITGVKFDNLAKKRAVFTSRPISYRKEREELGTPITQGRLDDFIREMQTSPFE